MAFQGNLNEFSVTDVLQLLGNQSKSGALIIERASEQAIIYLVDGRLVSTRNPGLSGTDPLLRFLLDSHRLSEEQHRGIITIQRESRRDLEDLLLNGRYMDAEELERFVERQILDELTRLMEWQTGSYKFDAQVRWPFTPLVRIPTEAAILEVVRRLDERQRHAALADDPQQVLSLRDLPDPDTLLSEEECEVFGIVDGRRTVAEVITAAPLSTYEGYETLFTMLERGWIEVTGRREDVKASGPSPPTALKPGGDVYLPKGKPLSLVHEVGVALVVALMILGLRLASIPLQPDATVAGHDVFAEARVHEVELALDLYRREYGHYPIRLEDLVDDRWLPRERLKVHGGTLAYEVAYGRARYTLEFEALPSR